MKLIIKIEEGISAERALQAVNRVISEGRISNSGKQYCYVTVFNEIIVCTDLTSTGTDVFHVEKAKGNK